MKGDRAFGGIWAALFLLLGLAPLRHGRALRLWALALSALLAMAAWLLPGSLHALSVVWTRLGRVLNRVFGPVAAAGVFYLAFTPAGVLLRLFRRDPLRQRIDPGSKTYWIERQGGAVDMRRVF